MARRDRSTSAVRFAPDVGADLGADVDGGRVALDTESPLPPTGPHDSDDLDPEVTDAAGLVDFGSIRVPVPPGGTVAVEPTAGDRMQAVHIRLPEGRLSVSALAAPKTSKLWPELAREIDASLREGGARVRSFPGVWGRELHAASGGATSVFVGADGPRWMLYGVATGPSAHAATLDAELRRMLRGTVVVRGKQPYPVRTILPLAIPDHLAEEAAATPAIPAPGAKKRSQVKAAAGKSAPGKAAPGKTAPPNSDAAAAAAKKAAARRAAARKAAAAAAVKAAAEALAEQAAEDRAAAGEHPDTGNAARLGRTGSHPVPGAIPTGPGPDAPLREQAPSARRAAAAAWRSRPGVPRSEAPPPTTALPVARPVEDPPVAEACRAPRPPADVLPPSEAVLPTEALHIVDPGTGGRRRLGEPAPPVPPPSRGRRHLQEPPAEESYPGGRSLRDPAADLPPTGSRYPVDPGVPGGGRRPLHEPDGAPGATAPWDLSEPGGRRRRHESASDTGVSASGRRRLREPWDGAERSAGRQPWEPGSDRMNGSSRPPAEPSATGPRDEHPRSGPDTGVSASGRRSLREPWDGAEPIAPAADTGVSASGRRRLREPWSPSPPAADTGVSASGRRRLREPWEGTDGSGGRRRSGEPAGSSVADPGPAPGAADTGVSASGRRRLRDPWTEGAGVDGPVADTGVSASGRRRLRESWDEGGPGNGPQPPGSAAADAGVSASGRRRLRDPWDEAGPDTGPRPWETGSGALNGSAGRRRPAEPTEPRVADTGVSATGRRRLRESWEAAPPDTGPREPAPGLPNGTGEHASGGRRRREYSGEPGPVGVEAAPPPAGTGVRASGRARLSEPWDDAARGGPDGSAGRRRPGEPEPVGRSARRRPEGDDLISGTGGRRRLRDTEPAPVREGSQAEPWLAAPDGPPDGSARRTLSAGYPTDSGEQDAGWSAGPDDHAERRGGRHSGAGDASPPTVRLQALLSELDPNRPRRRHRR